MHHAVLITAYRHPDYLLEMADFLDDRFSLFIHYDKRSSIEAGVLQQLKNHPRVRFFSQQYKVNWAGINHLHAILLLLREALKTDAAVFHTISGQDFPAMTCDQIDDIFRKNPERQYLEHFPMPAGHWKHGGMHRIWYWYFFDLFDHKSKSGNLINRIIRRVQTTLGVKRKWPTHLPSLNGGAAWWSITRSCASYIMDFSDTHPLLLKRLRFTLCPEELFFQTIVMNSPMANEVISDHMRYIDWNNRNGNSPANLDETDLGKIVHSGKLFARKFESSVSDRLLVDLKHRLNSPET